MNVFRRMKSRLSALNPSSESRWIILGVAVGLSYFLFNLLLPALLRGRNCCDAGNYFDSGRNFPKLRTLLTDYAHWAETSGHPALGYPFFLHVHHKILRGLGLDGLAWDFGDLSALTVIALHFFAVVFLYRSITKSGVRLHPVAMATVLASPGLTAIASLTLTDSLTASVLMIGMAAILQYRVLLAGITLGLAVAFRPSLQPICLLLLAVWQVLRLVQTWKQPVDSTHKAQATFKRLRRLPFLAFFGYFLVLSPQYAMCTRAYGKVCYIRPGYEKSMLPGALPLSLESPFWYGTFEPTKNFNAIIVGIPDPFFSRWFKGCPISGDAPLSDFLGCLASRWQQLPVYFGKKTIALFNNFQLNPYASWVTPKLVRHGSRLFGAIGFLGFFCLIFLFFRLLRMDPRSPYLLLGLFTIGYIAISTLFHVEARYGFPALALSQFSFVYVVQALVQNRSGKRKWGIAVLAVCAVLFVVQTRAWDAADPTVYENIRPFLTEKRS